MKQEHKDIQKVLPYGEELKGFVNQKFLSSAELHRILKERGVFALNSEKDFTAPLLQTLLLSPKEFDKIRESFSTKEENKKVFSRDIQWNRDIQIFSSDTLNIEVNDFIKQKLPTCTLKQPIRLIQVENNPNHLKAEFTIERNDLNKFWYEQTNVFGGSIEFINEDNGKGRVVISHTAPETKELAEFAVKEQIKKYKEKGVVPQNEELRKIVFNEFTNEERFVFFFRLTNHLKCDFFECENIRDISMKPEESVLPEEINWMEDMNKIILSGKALGEKFFIKDKKFHKHLILWKLESLYKYKYKGQEGQYTVGMGFPDFDKPTAEFELNISSINPSQTIDTRTRKILKSDLLSEMDRQKSIVYNNFIEYKNNNSKNNA